jgi:hypothetical protein
MAVLWNEKLGYPFSHAMTPVKSSNPTLSPKDWYLAIFLVTLTLLLGYGYMVVGVSGVYHDDAIYISTAKALAEGQGYRLINFPGAPAQTKYPPLYPLVLAVIWKIFPTFPENLIYMQLITLCFGAATVGLAYLYMVRFGYFTRGVAAGAAALTLTSIFYIYFCTITLSELPFALLSVGVLWALERQDEDPSPKPIGQFFLGMLLSLPVLVRTIGMLFIPLGFLTLWKRRRPLLWVTLGESVLLLPWLFWMLILPRWSSTDMVSTYYTNYLTWWYVLGKTAIYQIIANNIIFAAVATTFTGLSLFHPKFLQGWMANIALILGIVTWSFVVKDLWKEKILPKFLVMYLIIVLVWPWPPIRFLIPILTFILAYFLNWTIQAFKTPSVNPEDFYNHFISSDSCS